MAQIDAISGNMLKFMISDGGAPEAFAHRCMINTERTFKLDGTTLRTALPNCDDLDAASWNSTDIDTISADFDGTGTFDSSDVDFWYLWMTGNQKKKCRIQIGETGGYFEGYYLLKTFTITGPGKNKCTAQMSFESDGVVTYVA